VSALCARHFDYACEPFVIGGLHRDHPGGEPDHLADTDRFHVLAPLGHVEVIGGERKMLPDDVRGDLGESGIADRRNEIEAANVAMKIGGHLVDLGSEPPPLLGRWPGQDAHADDERFGLFKNVVEEAFHRAAHHNARPDEGSLPFLRLGTNRNAGHGILRGGPAKRRQFRPPVCHRLLKRRVAQFIEA